jgi:hypothetical protein
MALAAARAAPEPPDLRTGLPSRFLYGAPRRRIMTFEIVKPDAPGEPDAEDETFRQAQSNLREAPGDLEARAQFREALRLRRQTQALRRRAEKRNRFDGSGTDGYGSSATRRREHVG